jgi:hypothetical protein
MLNKIKCFFGYHDYFVVSNLTSYSRQIACHECKRLFAMNDDVEVVVPWDENFEELYSTYPNVVFAKGKRL